MQIAKRMAAVMAVVSLMAGTGLQAAAVSSANRLAISVNANVAAPAGARVGAKRGKESKILGIPLLLVAALGVAATAVVVTQVADNNHSDSP